MVRSSKYKVVYEIVLLSLGKGRSSIFFTDLKLLYSTWGEAELARQISSMPCLIAFARASTFAEGFQFVDYINSLQKRPIKSKKMYLILMTQQTIDETLLQNKTVHFNVHIINQDETGVVGNFAKLLLY